MAEVFKAKAESKRHGLGLIRRLVEQVLGTGTVDSEDDGVDDQYSQAPHIGWRRPRSGLKACFGSNHHKVYPAILEAFARQAIPSHFLEPVPVLAEIARCLLLRLKFRLQATRVARTTVFDLKKDCLLPFLETPFGRRGTTHRLFLREHFDRAKLLRMNQVISSLCGFTVTPREQRRRGGAKTLGDGLRRQATRPMDWVRNTPLDIGVLIRRSAGNRGNVGPMAPNKIGSGAL
jgi:hypothetical protein